MYFYQVLTGRKVYNSELSGWGLKLPSASHSHQMLLVGSDNSKQLAEVLIVLNNFMST